MYTLCRRLIFFAALVFTAWVQATPVTLKDVAGREVTVNAPVSRVILADSRMLLAVNILHPGDPLKSIIAWDDSLQRRAPDMARHYAQRYPRLKEITTFSNPYRSDFSIERAIALRPDLIVFDTGILPRLRASGTLGLLDNSGIAVMFIDFRQQPLVNAPVSMHLLGEVFAEQANAQRFIQRWQMLYQRVQKRVEKLSPEQRPGVVFENHAGMVAGTCCAVFGRSSYGEFITAAGGRNLLADRVPSRGADVSPELLIASNPDYYLLSGADWSQRGKASSAVPLGYDASRATALPPLQRLMQRENIAAIPAVRQGRVLAIYHQFYDSPFNVVALEAIAKFLHPALFADVDPQADLMALYRDFTGVPYSGLFFLQP